MDYKKEEVSTFAVIYLLVISGLLYSYVWIPSAWASFSSFPQHNTTSIIPKDELETALEGASMDFQTSIIPKDELETALEGASMENKTLIIAVVNKAYAKEGSMLDLFLQSFRAGKGTQFLLKHLLLVAVDQTAFDRCNLLHPHCYKLVTDGVDFSGEKIYMSDEFIKMMWQRTLFLADVLKRGYSFIFTDTDVMWLRNPFVRLSGHKGEEDLQISCDIFNGLPWDKSNPINTGFYFVASNNKTISLFDMWYASRNESVGVKEQDVLGRMIHEGVFERLDLRAKFLDTSYFGGFCKSSRDFRKVVTMHANCCRTIKAKIIDLTALLESWKNFRRSSNDTSKVQWPHYMGCFNAWRIAPNQTSD